MPNLTRPIISVFVMVAMSCATSTERRPSSEPNEVVVTYQKLATDAGQAILRKGGNAFDAFIASTLVQYVIGEGVTSAAGPLQAILYDAKSKEVVFLDGGFNSVRDPAGRWNPSDPHLGKAIVVPGAIRALEALSRKYGKLAFSECIQPAAVLAREGFVVTPFYAKSIQLAEENLRRSEYGRTTFFKDGNPLRAGDMLKLPRLAAFLDHLAREGANYMYQGKWARSAVELATAQGGKLTFDDLANYQAVFSRPLKISYRGHDIYGPAGRSFGGTWVAMALKALENWTPDGTSHYASSTNDLESLLRVSRAVEDEAWVFRAEKLDDRAYVEEKLGTASAKKLWDRAQNTSANPANHVGSHSYHVIVADQEGNAITGTNTIQAAPWADGNFVEGVILNNAGSLADRLYYGSAGGRRLSALSMHLVFQDQRLRFATGAFHTGLMPAELQFLVNLIDYRRSAQDSATLPRFGSIVARSNPRKNSISPRVDAKIIEALKARGLLLEIATPANHLDTGLGGVVVFDQDGTKTGAFAPILER